MVMVNENYLKPMRPFLFAEINRRLDAYRQEHPNQKVLNLGVGDVSLPLIPAVADAYHEVIDKMSKDNGFVGYGPEMGYMFLRETICQQVYKPLGVDVVGTDVYLSDGTKTDVSHILDILGTNIKAAIADPVYPVYLDTHQMANGDRSVVFLPCTKDNQFCPACPQEPVDIIYICNPNNPTGTAMNRDQMQVWVDYAIKNKSIILYDAAYADYVTDASIPQSIFELPRAKEVAIEFRSFSKSAGFTGLRCAYVTVCKEAVGYDKDGNAISLQKLWNMRQTYKYNGVSYPAQVAAAASLSQEGKEQSRKNILYYLENARLLKSSFENLGWEIYGGLHAPYLWLKTPKEYSSWQFFDYLLNNYQILGIPGSGFGPTGEGYLRLSAFPLRSTVEELMVRISKGSM